jgi:replicative DNA helicase
VESGRLLFAITDEICSEINEYKTRNRQITLLNDIISLHEAKYFYLCAGEWSLLRDAAVAVNELENYAFYQISNAYITINEIHLASDTIAENIISETSNQEEIQEIMNILKY